MLLVITNNKQSVVFFSNFCFELFVHMELLNSLIFCMTHIKMNDMYVHKFCVISYFTN